MSTPKKKMIVETSSVRAALNETNRHHHEHFKSKTDGAALHSSVYIRMEFIRAFIKPIIEVAFRVDHYGSVAEALGEIEEEFAIRKVKLGLQIVRSMLQDIGALGNEKANAKEIARLAIVKLKLFDRTFPSRINNGCGCRIGAKEMPIDYNKFFESLRHFMEVTANVSDCPINEFVGFRSPNGRTQKLLGHTGAAGTKAGQNLSKYANKTKHIDCGRCSRIGDAVIALEQGKSFDLVHIDGAFNELCDATGRSHIEVKSARKCANEACANVDNASSASNN